MNLLAASFVLGILLVVAILQTIATSKAYNQILLLLLEKDTSELDLEQIKRLTRFPSFHVEFALWIAAEKEGMVTYRWEPVLESPGVVRRQIYSLTYKGLLRGKKEAGAD